MRSDTSAKLEFERCGRVWFRNAISESDLSSLDDAAKLQTKAGQRIDLAKGPAGVFSPRSSLTSAIRAIDPDAQSVRVIAFNKSKETNWAVPWHQDRVIAVSSKCDVSGFKNWTKKTGIWHCEPPPAILDQMLFVRIHLDDTDHSNGAMQIAVGSHKAGIIPTVQAEMIASQYPIESCEAKRGDILVLKMLTLHSSKPSSSSVDRRVFRIDFASFDLPKPLRWA